MADKEWGFRSIRELGDALRMKETTPLKLTEYFLNRLEQIGPRYNAVVTVTRERAMAEAATAEQELMAGKDRGPLHGIPYGLKDLIATNGTPTTWGAEPYRNQKFDYDATIVERLTQAGAVLVAKLSMVELAGGMGYNHADAAFNGPGLNPWNEKFWSGGSSSGPGSAIAAGLVPFAIGSETSGSILTPSAFCGATGLRPTYGRVSRHGAMALCWTLDKLGPMTRSADDCGLVMAAIAGRDPRDATSLDKPFSYKDETRLSVRPKVAVAKGSFDDAQPAVRDNFLDSLEVLGRFCEITRNVEWPDFPWGPAVGTIVNAEGAAAFVDLIDAGGLAKLRCPREHYAGYSGMFTYAVDYVQAMRVRGPMKRAVAKLFEQYDVIVAPTRASVAYPADIEFNKTYPDVRGGPALIPGGNLCGLPALCAPNGFGESGLPTSIQWMGAPNSEELLVAIGNEYQARTDWHTKKPAGV
jgi:aspartyl-tRNA(Asn)/glutamyl-tRNA(Gln) amidotransferase subunit A